LSGKFRSRSRAGQISCIAAASLFVLEIQRRLFGLLTHRGPHAQAAARREQSLPGHSEDHAMTDPIRPFAPVPPGAQPPYLHADYGSTVKRAPQNPPIRLEREHRDPGRVRDHAKGKPASLARRSSTSGSAPRDGTAPRSSTTSSRTSRTSGTTAKSVA